MFLDERINAEQGRAFRFTVIFAWAVTVLYGIFHFVMLMTSNRFLMSSLSVEIFCGIGGAILIGIGELSKWSEVKIDLVFSLVAAVCGGGAVALAFMMFT